MVTNVSEKDKTLQEIIAWCERLETEGRRHAKQAGAELVPLENVPQ